jgi:hypothetical protein
MNAPPKPPTAPKAYFTHAINGVTYKMNRYGVVFAPTTPDPHFPGYGNLNFAEPAERDAVKVAARDAGHSYKLIGHGWNSSEHWNF